MKASLFFQALLKFFSGLILFSALIFISAGTLDFFNGKLLVCLLFIPMFCAGLVLMAKNPSLLEKRLNAKEKEDEQKSVIALSALMFLLAFITAGLNFRFSWFVMPRWSVYAASAVFILSYIMYAEVLRENEFLSRTIEIQENQRVIDTGLYSVIRHPMYSATLFLFLSMPLILGSPVSFLILLFYIPIISKRMKNEEEVLVKGLEGYEEYRKKVKYKVIPYIW